jgi:hypothetical protein
MEKEQKVAAERDAGAGEAGVKVHAKEPAGHVSVEEARRRVQRVILDWAVETVKAGAGSEPG